MKASEACSTYCVVVNISSLLAIKSLAGFGLYCPSKHARDSLFEVIAQEEVRCKEHLPSHNRTHSLNLSLQDPAKIRALNYAPGPLDTEMQKEIREGLVNEALRTSFKEMFDQVGGLTHCVHAYPVLTIARSCPHIRGS
jgi:sepiapterin reductase